MNGVVRALLVNENIGGHATVHHHLRTVAASRDDIDVTIVDVPPPGFWRKAFGVAVPGLGRVDADLRPIRYQLAQSAWVARQLPRWLAGPGGPFDVVHLYTHNVGLLSSRALNGVPSVVTLDSTNAQSNLLHPVREPTRWSGLSTPLVRPFERRVYERARTVVANSRWTADSLVADYGIDRRRIEVIPMGVPLPESLSATSPLSDGRGSDGQGSDGLGSDGQGSDGQGSDGRLPRLIFIGFRMARKGGFDLLAAHQRWLADRCELVLVTTDDVPPGRRVTVVDDARPGDGTIDRLLDSAQILVFPSRIDQWPNAVMEAMAHGVVPVVSRVGGLPEMVLDGEAGVLLSDNGPEGIRDAVTGLLDDPARWQRLSARARRRVVEDLDVRHTADRLLDVVRWAARPSG